MITRKFKSSSDHYITQQVNKQYAILTAVFFRNTVSNLVPVVAGLTNASTLTCLNYFSIVPNRLVRAMVCLVNAIACLGWASRRARVVNFVRLRTFCCECTIYGLLDFFCCFLVGSVVGESLVLII